jgi:putative NIF3 family GTP cyclohydrolase 1 type 2
MATESNLSLDPNGLGRRKFIYNIGAVVGAGVALTMPFASQAASFIKPVETYTVKQIMDLFIKDVPGGVKKSTVDTLKSGSPDTVVTGIVTTMFATIEVINKAIAIGANFIIAHEPTFYNHADDTGWLQKDEVYLYKAALLKKHNIAVWRNHDYIHSISPDPVTMGVLDQLGWRAYADKNLPNLVILPVSTLKDTIDYVKTRLNIEKVRYVGGPPEEKCSRVLFLPGSPGGTRQIQAIERYKPSLVLCGEISEWETAEYVRDARAKGESLSLAVLGHIASEEPGSEFMLKWLKGKVPEIKSIHIPAGNSMLFL